MRLWFVASLLLCLSGCFKIPILTKKQTVTTSNKRLLIQEELARLTDIPDTPGTSIVKKVVRDKQLAEQTQVQYKTSLSLQEIADFYQHEMERLGWDMISQYKSSSLNLTFENPSKVATVTYDGQQGLVVTAMSKR